MFTQDFRKLKLSASVIGIVILIYMTQTAGLLSLANWAESTLSVYPHRDEDWLRYLSPSVFESKQPKVLLTGPSAVRECLLTSRFNTAFDSMRTIQGAISQGGISDVNLSLDYLERSYGADAIPKIIVLGLTPRTLGDFPRVVSPFVTGINSYSPYFKTIESKQGTELVPKNAFESLVSRIRFAPKQTSRYRTALFAIAARIAGQIAPGSRAEDFFHQKTVPYLYHQNQSVSVAKLNRWQASPTSFWPAVLEWNPDADADRVRQRSARLLDFVRRHDIDLYLVNLAENPISRAKYNSKHIQAYQNLITECFDGIPWLDLRESVPQNDFIDIVHLKPKAANRVTDEVIEFINQSDKIACEGSSDACEICKDACQCKNLSN